MLASPAQVTDRSILDFDVCIAGAGAAGITVAIELRKSGLRIGLIEAGGLEPPPLDLEHPYNGTIEGREYSLLGTRLRYFGGTTNHWGGWCRRLDEIDFMPRPYVPLSGWPISRSALDSYYDTALRICEISPPPAYELQELGYDAHPPEHFFEHYDPEFSTKNFRFSPPTRFGQRYRNELEQAGNVVCLLDSTVTRIDVSDDGAVSQFVVHSGDKTFFAKAAVFVLAMGAIENARLLLNSDEFQAGGLGNQNDFVGRCFADHPGRTIGFLLARGPLPYSSHHQGSIQVLPHLSLRDDVLIREGIVNFGLVLAESSASSPIGRDYFADTDLFPGWTGLPGARLYSVTLRLEATPNPDSRVVLVPEKDRFGMRRILLNWQLNTSDFESMERISDIVGKKVGKLGLGRFRRLFRDDPRERRGYLAYQSHHMGTTRMSKAPESGVVDENCRVHTIDNLYIAGSSVFPTFGFANPTLTIVALALRLAEHLEETLKNK